MVRYLERLWRARLLYGGRQFRHAMIRAFLKSLLKPAPRVIREVPLYLEPQEADLALLDSQGELVPVTIGQCFTVEEMARSLRNDGYSLRYIAAELGISYYKARKFTMA